MGKCKAKGHWDRRSEPPVWMPAPATQARRRGDTATHQAKRNAEATARSRERKALALTAAVGGLPQHLELRKQPASWAAAATLPWSSVAATAGGATLQGQSLTRSGPLAGLPIAQVDPLPSYLLDAIAAMDMSPSELAAFVNAERRKGVSSNCSGKTKGVNVGFRLGQNTPTAIQHACPEGVQRVVAAAARWASELVHKRLGRTGARDLAAHISFIDPSYSLGGQGVVSGAFMALGHTGAHVDSSDVKGSITVAIPLSVCVHISTTHLLLIFTSYTTNYSPSLHILCVQGGCAQLCVHPARVAGVEVKGGGQLTAAMEAEIVALRHHLHPGPLRTEAYGADLQNAVWGTFSSLPHGGLTDGAAFSSLPRVVLTLYAEVGLTVAHQQMPTKVGVCSFLLRLSIVSIRCVFISPSLSSISDPISRVLAGWQEADEA